MSATEIKPSFIWVAISIGAFCQRRISSLTPLVRSASATRTTGALRHIRTMPGGEFLWLLTETRAAKAVSARAGLWPSAYELQAGWFSYLQLVLRVPVPSPRINLQRSPVLCQSCEKAMNTDR